MIEFKTNNIEFLQQLHKVPTALKRGLRQGADASGKQLIKALVKDMRLPKSGRTYRTSIGKTGKKLRSPRAYNASAPSETPAIVTGEFRRSLGFEVQGSSRLVFGSGKDDIAKYAKFLEEGTSRMKARKPLQRTAKKMNNKIDKNLVRAIRKELKNINIPTRRVSA